MRDSSSATFLRLSTIGSATHRKLSGCDGFINADFLSKSSASTAASVGLGGSRGLRKV